MSNTLFFRTLAENDKAIALEEAIHKAGEGHTSNLTTYIADPSSFSLVPGSPFAYWVSEQVHRIFTTFSRFASEGRDAQSGASTMNDFRFLRLWWEIEAKTAARDRATTFHNGRWVPFAKGGVFSPFYSDWELVIDWHRDGEVLKQEVSNYRSSHGWGHQWTAAINGHSSYFFQGLTWPRRTQRGLNVRVLPKGCIFADKGPAIFSAIQPLEYLLGISNSLAFRGLVSLQMAFGSYEVGVIERTPIPITSEAENIEMGNLALACVAIKRNLDQVNETSHIFYSPVLVKAANYTLDTQIQAWQQNVRHAEEQLADYQGAIDDLSLSLYSITHADQESLELSLVNAKNIAKQSKDKDDEDDGPEATISAKSLVVDLLSYTFGCVLGRWDIRYAIGELPTTELPDPFAPLPVCSPGMLTGEDGLPLLTTPAGYPLDIKWDGIIVDDPDHPEDIVRRVREVLAVIWQDRAEAIEQEICQILEITDLRDYFRRPGKGGFWDDHIQRYSKSRRKAPIYWLLQSEKRNYGIWIYYHRLDKDLLFKALVNYVEPKLRMGEDALAQLKAAQNPALVGREARQVEQKIERQERLLTELTNFRDKLSRAANLGLKPDLNDGVVLNIAPLHELVPWKEAKKYWDELEKGKYEWSSVSQQLRAKGKM